VNSGFPAVAGILAIADVHAIVGSPAGVCVPVVADVPDVCGFHAVVGNPWRPCGC